MRRAPPKRVENPREILVRMRAICRGLPEAYEEPSWAGRRWRIRGRTFADLRTTNTERGPITWIKFRSRPPELNALLQSGRPFFSARDSTDRVGMIVDMNTDWREVAELLAESYRSFAPERLAARLAHREASGGSRGSRAKGKGPRAPTR